MVRSFVAEPVPRTVLETLLGQCLSGPSAGNSQSLQLLVLTDGAIGSYWNTTLPVARRAAFPWPGLMLAPILIVPYVEPDRYVERYREPDKRASGLGGSATDWPVPYWWVDGGAAVQTLLLGAAAKGIGACLFGQFEHETAVRECFDVPEGMRAVGTVAVGYEDIAGRRPSVSVARGRRDRLETVHWNTW